LQAQVVEDQRRLAVANRLADLAVTATELLQRKVPVGLDVVGIGLQQVAAIGCPPALPLAQQVVGEIGGEALAPVAAVFGHVNPVAPPVVQHLVGIGGGQDERQAQDSRSQQGEGGHPVAGLPEVLDQGELGVGVGPDQAAVEVQVFPRGGQVGGGKVRVRTAQPDLGLGCRSRLPVECERGGDEIDVVLGL